MARFSAMILILAVLVFAGQSNAFSLTCYAGCMIACMQGGGPGGASRHVHQQQQQRAVVFDNNNYQPDGLISCATQCMQTCVNPPAQPPPETPVPPTPEAPQVPAPVPPTPEAPQVPAPVPPTPEAPKAPEAPVAAAPQPSSASAPAPPPCGAVAEQEEVVVGLASYLNEYCELGCAARLCATLSTPSNLAPAEIKNCVHNCSQMCKRKY